MTTLNEAFETELAQEGEGYESGSENFNIPTPLSRAPRIYHVSTVDDHPPLQSSMKSLHLRDTDAAASHATA